MFKTFDPDETAWLISTIYLAAKEDDSEEAVRVFHAVMKACIKELPDV
jgi:hypothetical protein